MPAAERRWTVERPGRRADRARRAAALGQVRDRAHGARSAMAAHGLDPGRLVEIPTAALTVAEGRSSGQRLAGLPPATRPTSAFCANDLLALGLLQQCVALGVRVPQELAIVGYDDIDFAAAAAVPLTSIRQPRHELGATAARLLLEEATATDHAHERVLFTPELIVRGSTRSGALAG